MTNDELQESVQTFLFIVHHSSFVLLRPARMRLAAGFLLFWYGMPRLTFPLLMARAFASF